MALECYLVKGALIYGMKTNSCTIKNDDDNDKNNIYYMLIMWQILCSMWII